MPDIDLGLAVAGAITPPHTRLTHADIAAFCGCTKSYIWLLEQQALHKLRRRVFLRNDPLLRELGTSILRATGATHD